MTERSALAARIAELWRTAQTMPLHGPHCGCHGGATVSLDAQGVEDDLLDYLLPRYKAAGELALVSVLERRQKAPGPSFVEWLDRETAGNLTAKDHTRLLGDIASSLESLCAHAHGG